MSTTEPLQKISHNYPFKVWGASLVVAPILYMVGMIIINIGNSDMVGLIVIPYFIFFGLLLSTPTLLVFYIAHKDLVKSSLPSFTTRMVLAIIAITGMFITFLMIMGSPDFDRMTITVFSIYAVTIISAAFYFRLYQEDIPATNEKATP